MRCLLRFVLILLSLAPSRLLAAEIQVLSAGAMEPGLESVVQSFRSASSQAVRISYATAPRLRELLNGLELPDLLIAPHQMFASFAGANRPVGVPVQLGRIGVGMAARAGVSLPGVEDAEGLRRIVTQMQSLVFNRASTGLYMDRLFEQLGLSAVVAAKARRYPTGAEVMEHLLRGSGQELGFGAITEIRMVRELRYLGPLPADVQAYTLYSAALLPEAPAAAAALLRWLSGPEARAVFDAAGIEAPR